MKEYYDLIDNIYNYLIGNVNINTVTKGDLMEVDLSKSTIFPLAHIIVNDGIKSNPGNSSSKKFNEAK